jgi:hypothetical protein
LRWVTGSCRRCSPAWGRSASPDARLRRMERRNQGFPVATFAGPAATIEEHDKHVNTAATTPSVRAKTLPQVITQCPSGRLRNSLKGFTCAGSVAESRSSTRTRRSSSDRPIEVNCACKFHASSGLVVNCRKGAIARRNCLYMTKLTCTYATIISDQ